MPISDSTRTTLRQKLFEYEGKVEHFYLDTRGKVTVGVGHLIPNRSAVSAIVMHHIDSDQLASENDKQAEYDKISALPWGQQYGAGSFEPHASLYMKDTDIDAVTDHHIDNFYAELSNIYSTSNDYPVDFDNLNEKVQLALFDMIFNLGAHKLANTYPSFNRHLKNADYAAAATECDRRGISPARNDYVRNLLIDASRA